MSVLRPKEGDFGGSRRELQTSSVVGNNRMPAGGLACRTFKFLWKKKKQAQGRKQKVQPAEIQEKGNGGGEVTYPMGPRPGALPPAAVDFRKRQVT